MPRNGAFAALTATFVSVLDHLMWIVEETHRTPLFGVVGHLSFTLAVPGFGGDVHAPHRHHLTGVSATGARTLGGGSHACNIRDERGRAPPASLGRPGSAAVVGAGLGEDDLPAAVLVLVVAGDDQFELAGLDLGRDPGVEAVVIVVAVECPAVLVP
jgi:hypothetical protein